MNELTLRDRIFTEIKKLQGPMAGPLYPYHTEDDGEVYPQCHFCGEAGLFHSGNGGIAHIPECTITLTYRLYVNLDKYSWFDQLAYKSILYQIANIERWPRKPIAGYADWQYFCPFCQCLLEVSKHKHEDGSSTITYTMPHTDDCIVTLAKAELEQQGGKA